MLLGGLAVVHAPSLVVDGRHSFSRRTDLITGRPCSLLSNLSKSFATMGAMDRTSSADAVKGAELQRVAAPTHVQAQLQHLMPNSKGLTTGSPSRGAICSAPARPKLRMSVINGCPFRLCRVSSSTGINACAFVTMMLKDIQCGESGGTGHRVSTVGISVGQLDHVFRLIHVHQTIVNLARGQHGAHGDGAIGQPFGDIHHVRFNPEGVCAKGAPTRPKPVITSSKISKISFSSQISRRRCK